LARSRAHRKQNQQIPYPDFFRLSEIELDMVYKRYNIHTMNGFEYDEEKSNTNSKKHGIDFIEAQKLWKNPDLLEIPAKTQDEERFLLIGKIEEKLWSGVITYRNKNIRIISVRRSREEEIELYESI